ncbi:MAG: mono/diheme cytochrome c family protein, partial [Myxococcota bacterium]
MERRIAVVRTAPAAATLLEMLFALALLFACTATDRGPGAGATTDSAASTSQPTWHADIAPILSAHCSGCHAAGGLAATLPWTRYEDTAP